MNTTRIAILLCLAAGACDRAERRDVAPTPSAAARPAPFEELDRLDQRKPLPLLPMMAHHQKQNMRDHLLVVQEVVAATAAGDFPKVAEAAQRIGYSDAMGQMCEHMGAGSPGFAEQALAFHRSADHIVAAAKRQDSAAVLAALSSTLSSCTGCHAAYKQKIVDQL